jgi:two-component system phosphate regulon sensor histidine kinase PhoR
VLGASEVGFVFVDRQGTIGYVTELAARLLGLEVLPKGLPVKVLEDMIAARTDDDVTGILDRGGPLRIAGEPRRFLAVHIGEVHGESGILAGRLISIRDETSQRELELAREEFLGVAAHELKNPLAALQLQAELGLRGEATKRAEALDKIRRKSHELTQLVERLLDVTRADLGRLVTELVPVDLGELAADVAEGFAGGAAEVRVSPEEGARVVGDPTRIRQVVTNLLSNAVRYAGDRGPIDLEVRRAGDEVRVAVRDRGPGIAEAERARIFERFGQGRTGKRGPGLGIGLYLARRIAEEHGGRLELATEVGKGSTFTLVLPARPVERPVAQNRPA